MATIIRNLSFEDDNAAVLASSETLLRFCLLCCSSYWGNLNQMGFDILGNVASGLELEESRAYESCVTDVMLDTLANGIKSRDRFQVRKLISLSLLVEATNLKDFLIKYCSP